MKNKNLIEGYWNTINKPVRVSSTLTNYEPFTFEDGSLFFKTRTIPKVKKVIFQKTHTIVLWEDGDKTIVNCYNEDFDEEKGLAMAITKKIMTRNDFKRLIKNASYQERWEVK